MPNPFQGMMGGNMPGPFGAIAEITQAFNQFKANFQGDPQQKVQELLQSGRINQDVLNRAQQMAKQIGNMMKKD